MVTTVVVVGAGVEETAGGGLLEPRARVGWTGVNTEGGDARRAGGFAVWLGSGIRLAALGMLSSPIVMPVTGSFIGLDPCWSQDLIWATVGREPNRDW